jgi:hypothetical protein
VSKKVNYQKLKIVIFAKDPYLKRKVSGIKPGAFKYGEVNYILCRYLIILKYGQKRGRVISNE